jgi:hypothetical protein
VFRVQLLFVLELTGPVYDQGMVGPTGLRQGCWLAPAGRSKFGVTSEETAGSAKTTCETWPGRAGAEEFGPVPASAASRCANNSATERDRPCGNLKRPSGLTLIYCGNPAPMMYQVRS